MIRSFLMAPLMIAPLVAGLTLEIDDEFKLWNCQ